MENNRICPAHQPTPIACFLYEKVYENNRFHLVRQPTLTCRAPSVILALAGWRAVDPSMAELGRPEKPLKPKKPLVFNVFPMPEHKKPKKPLVFNVFGVPALKNH